MKQSITNYMKFILSWVCSLEVLESLSVKNVLARIRIDPLHPFEKGRSHYKLYSCIVSQHFALNDPTLLKDGVVDLS